MDESALVERAKTDKESFGQLYEQHVDRIYNYIYYKTSNHADAEDLTSKVFFRAWQHIGRFQDQGVPFSAWLYRIAHNLVANWHRDNSRRRMISLDDVANWHVAQDGPERLTEMLDDQESLLDAIHRLPADRQDLLILKYVEQLSNVEIGTVLGRSEGAVKSLYHRTLLSLRDDLHGSATQPAQAKGGWRRFLPGQGS